MTLEDLLTEITAAGWYTRLVEVNATIPHNHRDMPEHSFPKRCWMADLYNPEDDERKTGYGESALAAIARAWAAEGYHRDSLYLRHPDPQSTARSLSAVLKLSAPTAPFQRRF